MRRAPEKYRRLLRSITGGYLVRRQAVKLVTGFKICRIYKYCC